MKDPFRQRLREIIAKFGPALAADAERCESVLRTLVGAYETEITILWTASLYKPYPFQPEAERPDFRSRGPRVTRGGAWDSNAEAIRTTRRARGDPAARLYTRGFRCAR